MAHNLTPLTFESDADAARSTYLEAVLVRLNDAQGPKRQTSREEVQIDGVWLRIHRPHTNAFGNPPGVVVFVRGGYGSLGNRDTHDALAKRYVDLPAVVISVDIANGDASFDSLVDAVLTAVRHADNAPLIRTTLSTEVAFVGVDVGAAIALEAATRLSEDKTLGNTLTNEWTVKAVHCFDPIAGNAMIDLSLETGLVSGADMCRLVEGWPALADAKAVIDGLDELAFPVLVSVSSHHPGAEEAEEIFTRLEAINDHRVLGMSLNIEGAESVLITKTHPVAEGAIAGVVAAFRSLAALPQDDVK